MLINSKHGSNECQVVGTYMKKANARKVKMVRVKSEISESRDEMYFRYPYFWERKLITANDIIFRVAISRTRDTSATHITPSRNVNDDCLAREEHARSLSAASVKYRDKEIGKCVVSFI